MFNIFQFIRDPALFGDKNLDCPMRSQCSVLFLQFKRVIMDVRGRGESAAPPPPPPDLKKIQCFRQNSKKSGMKPCEKRKKASLSYRTLWLKSLTFSFYHLLSRFLFFSQILRVSCNCFEQQIGAGMTILFARAQVRYLPEVDPAIPDLETKL